MPSSIIARETVLKCHAFDIQKVDVRLPDGRIHPYDLVHHPPAVTILPVDQEGNIWFVRQFRVGVQDNLLELPAGTLEENEDPAEGAAREVREEIGMAAGKLQKLGDFYQAAGYCDEFMHVFLATALYPAPLEADADEFLEVEKIPVQKAYQMAARGELHDGKTLTALMMAYHMIFIPL
jgi:ADP-ribose pyrophosphatase